MMKIVYPAARFTLASVLILRAVAQSPKESYPLFENYPAKETFSGKPALPKLVRSGDRLFRTKIGEGSAKGPNFAGHLTVAEWGCGSGCVSIAVVDAKDGRIYPAPFGILGWGTPVQIYEGKFATNQDRFKPLDYRLDSRLLVVRGCPEDKNCGSYFYEWTGSELKLVRRVQADPVARP